MLKQLITAIESNERAIKELQNNNDLLKTLKKSFNKDAK